MKLFKKSVSVFLAVLMIFGSFSILATAAEKGEYNWSLDTKFYRYDGTEWVQTTKAKKGESVKARVFLTTDFALTAGEMLFYYPSEFLTFDPSGYPQGTTSTSYSLTVNNGTFKANLLPGVGATSLFNDMLWEGYITEEDIEGQSWIMIASMKPLNGPVQFDGKDWFFELDFIVNSEPTGEGQLYLSTECIADYDYFMSLTVLGADLGGGDEILSCDEEYLGQFVYTSNDQDADSTLSANNTVVFTTDNGTITGTKEYSGDIGDKISTIEGFALPTAAAEGKQFLGWSTDGKTVLKEDDIKALEIGYEPVTLKAVFQAASATYTQNVYTMDTTGAYGAAVDTTPGSTPGTMVNAAAYSVPTGFTLDTDKSTAGDVEVKEDGSSVLDIYLKRNQYKATFGDASTDVYYEATYTAPAGADTETGIFEYWVNAADENDILYAGDTATMGLADVTYTAKYKALNDVTYVFAGTQPDGVSLPAAGKTSEGATIAKPAVTVPDGYTLVWTAEGATANEDGTFTAGAGDVTITGTWAKIPYSVTYVYAGDTPDGLSAPAGTTLTVGDAITAPDVTIPDGYELTWETEGDVDGKMGTAPVIMTGTWKKIAYSITYSFEGEAPVAAPEATTGTMGQPVELPELEEDGWTFEGWTVSGAVAEGTGYKVGTAPVTVTGKWIKNTYTVKFFLDSAKTVPYFEVYTYEFGDAVEFPADPEILDLEDAGIYGMYFDSWDFDPIDEVNAETVDSHFTEVSDGQYVAEFIALTSDIEYTATIRCASPSNGFATVTLEPLYYGDTITADDLPDTYIEGYTFDYWMVNGQKVTEWADYTVTGNTQINAFFKVNSYEAVFDGNGGYWLDENDEPTIDSITLNVNYGDQITAPTSNPVRTGYHLDPEMNWDPELGMMDVDGAYFEAQWIANEYTITFVVEGTSYESTQTYDNKLALPAEVVTENVKPGYSLKGWTADGGATVVEDITTLDVPAENTTYTAVFAPSAGGVDYKVNRYFMNTDGNYDGVTADTVTLHEVAETPVTYNATVEGFTLDTSLGNLSGTVAGDGSLVLNAYYERNEYTASFVAGDETITDEVYFDAAIEAPAYDKAPAGYELIGWSTTEGATSADADLGKMTTAGATFYAVYRAKDTAYNVEIYLMGTDGKYGAAAETVEKTGKTDTLATAAHSEYAQEAYFSADDAAANVTSANINGDGSTVLKLYYKRAQYNVTVDGADAGTVYYGAEFTTPSTTTEVVDGYTFAGWTDGVSTYAPGAAVVVTGTLALETVNTANDDTAYTVEIYLMGTDGKYGAAADTVEKAGTTDTNATAAHSEYTQAAYFSADDAAANVTSANINGNGSTVLKLYYKRAQYNVTVDGEAAGAVYHDATFTTPATSTTTTEGYTLTGWTDGTKTYGLNEAVTVTGALDLEAVNTANEYTVTFIADGSTVASGDYAFGTKISTIAPSYTAPEGYTFKGWATTENGAVVDFTDDVTVPVDGVTYYAVIEADSGVKYTIKTYIQNTSGVYAPQADDVAYGTTGEEITYVPATKEGFSVDEAQSKLVIDSLAGDGSSVVRVFYSRNEYKVTVDGVEDTYYYEEVIELADPTPDAGYSFTGWVDGEGNEVESPFTVPADDVVITATYAPIKYDVTFNVDGEEYATGKYDFDTVIVAPADDPSKVGYTFEGWSTDGKTVLADLGKVVVGGNTFEAVFSANSGIEYTVNKIFQTVDGSDWEAPEAETRTGTAGDTVALDKNAEAVEGFAVYNIDPASTTIAGDGSTVINIYYTRNKVSVTIDGDKDDYYFGETIEEPTDTAKEGYDFIGWVDEDGKTVTFPVTVPAEDMVITPVYEAQTKSLSFVVDGTAVEGYPTTAKVDSDITAPAEPTKDGYKFLGWYAQGTNAEFNGKMPTTDVVYEAKWTAGDHTQYAITIYMMDTNGQYTMSTTTVSHGVTGAIASIVPGATEGFTYDGTLSELSKEIAADGSTVLKIYYARDLYTVTWNVDGLETEEEVYFGAAINAPEDPAKDGYTFAGWDPAVPATMPAEDVEFAATWTETTYTITYVVNGTKETESYKYGDTVTVKAAPSVEGMSFNGWFDGNTEYKAGSTFTMPAEDLIIVADFSIAVYKVTYLDANGAVFTTEMVKFGDPIPVPAEEPTKEYHVFTGWEINYDKMPAEDIVVAPIFERISVKLIPMAGSTTVIDTDNMVIYGLQEYLTESILRNDYLAVEGDGFITITPVDTGCYGTGTKVTLYDNLAPTVPVETYTIVVFGDINGDSFVQAIDCTYADEENLMITDWSQEQIFDGSANVANPNYDLYKTMAADLNGDGIIDSTDATIIGDASIGIIVIDQVTGRPA